MIVLYIRCAHIAIDMRVFGYEMPLRNAYEHLGIALGSDNDIVFRKISPFKNRLWIKKAPVCAADGSIILVYYINMLCFNGTINRKKYIFFVEI